VRNIVDCGSLSVTARDVSKASQWSPEPWFARRAAYTRTLRGHRADDEEAEGLTQTLR